VPAVIRRIQTEFVPLALRAPAVNLPHLVPDEAERWLYQRLNRAKLAPQGIGVLNSAGQVLAWVQMFDDDQSVLDFLDYSLKRFAEKKDAKELVVTQRYLRFPGDKASDYQDETKLPTVVAEAHPKGKRCPAEDGKGKVAPGSINARLVGRALDRRGEPVTDMVKQEHYVEDQFAVAPNVQQMLMKALGNAGAERVRLPDEFSKLCATHAHLGHLDVQPCLCMVKGKAENKGEWKRCEFWARQVQTTNGTTRWQVDGQSEVVSELTINGNGVHDVTLAWEGFLETRGQRVTRLVLSARGTEKLQFAKDNHPLLQMQKDEVAFLPAGRPVDLACGVRYGILGELTEPVPIEEKPGVPADPEQIPDEARKQLVEALGGPFLVFRDKVQAELKLSKDQQQKLLAQLPDYVRETMMVFEKLQDAKPPEREQALQEHRRRSDEKLSALLQEVLDAAQRHRLFQLQLQQAGAFALLGENEAFLKLKITEEQHKQIMEVVQQMHRKIELLVKENEPGGKPEEIMPKVRKLRNEHEGRIKAILTDTQRKEWTKLLGKPFNLGD
jgi:hypothetical protein